MATMTINGCSTCITLGTENYNRYSYGFGRRKKTAYQYDYRHTDGELFSTCAPTLEQCRERRDNWLAKHVSAGVDTTNADICSKAINA